MIPAYETQGIAASWRQAGQPPPVPPSAVGATSCVILTCTGLAFVQVRTPEGYRSLCLKHFEAVSARVTGSQV